VSGTTETAHVHFEDLDAQGVLHNARYAMVLDRGLAAYWGRAGYPLDPSAAAFRDAFFVIREFTITYHAPVTRPGPVAVRLWIEHVGNSSLVYGYQIMSHDETVTFADGRRVHVCVDPATFRPVRIDSRWREAAGPLIRQPGRAADGAGLDGAPREPDVVPG
jgi:acyl-CoA thioester hydrolase